MMSCGAQCLVKGLHSALVLGGLFSVIHEGSVFHCLRTILSCRAKG